MLVRNYMTREILTLTPGGLCRDALRVFQKERIRHAPVVEDGNLVGVVSERDLLRLLPGSIAESEREAATEVEEPLVRQAMTHSPLTVGTNTWLEDAARILIDARVGCLPVLQDKRLVGIVTADDLFQALVDVATSNGEHRFSWRRVNSGPSFDVAVACVKLGLRLTSLLNHGGERDSEFLVARVTGSDEACTKLVAWAADHGYQLFASEDEGSLRAS